MAAGKTLVQVSMGEGGETFYVGASGSSPVLGVIHTSDDSDTILDDTRRWTEVRALPIDRGRRPDPRAPVATAAVGVRLGSPRSSGTFVRER